MLKIFNGDRTAIEEIGLFETSAQRDQCRERLSSNRFLEAVCTTLQTLSDAELDRVRIGSHPRSLEHDRLAEACAAEKLTRLRKTVDFDVNKILNKQSRLNVNDLLWTVVFVQHGAIISVSIDGNGRCKAPLCTKYAEFFSDTDLTRLTRKLAFSVAQTVMPVLLRLTPKPPDTHWKT